MKTSFAAFYQRWGDHVEWDVPDIHLMACEWMQHERKGRVAVLKGFRGLSKSTLAGRYVPWKLSDNDQWRFLNMSSTDPDAAKLSADARHVIDSHPWCGHMKPKRGLWQVHRFALDKHEDPRNPNVATFGIMSNITGGRADEVIFDDVEVPRTIRTPELRTALRQRLSETTHILVPGGKKLYIGTDHCFESIYKEQIEQGADLLEIPLFQKEITHTINSGNSYLFSWRITKPEELYVAVGLNRPRLLDESEYKILGLRHNEGVVRLKIQVPEGERISIYSGNNWPRRFTRSEIEFRMKECLTWGEFDSQYQLRPAQLSQVRLDPSRLINYAGEPELRFVNGEVTLWLNGIRMVGASTYWDCSLGKKKSDTSALCVVFSDAAGWLYWHVAEALTGEIDEQCQQAIKVIKALHLPAINVETNGPGGFVPAILRRHLKVSGISCSVNAIWVRTNKNLRILDAVEPPLSGMFLHAGQQVQASPAINQMREWNPQVADQPDDYMDALAGAIAETPVRIGNGLSMPEHSPDRWTPGGGCFEAQTDF